MATEQVRVVSVFGSGFGGSEADIDDAGEPGSHDGDATYMNFTLPGLTNGPIEHTFDLAALTDLSKFKFRVVARDVSGNAYTATADLKKNTVSVSGPQSLGTLNGSYQTFEYEWTGLTGIDPSSDTLAVDLTFTSPGFPALSDQRWTFVDSVQDDGVAAVTHLKEDLVFYAKLDEGAGATRVDSHDSIDFTDHATVGASSGTGPFGGDSADFEESSSHYLSHADEAAIQTGDIDFTIAVRCRLESLPGTSRHILSKFETSGDHREYALQWSVTQTKFAFFVSSDGGSGAGQSNVVASAAGDTVAGTDYWVFAWHDASEDKIAIEVNGQTNFTFFHSGGVNIHTAPLHIGAAGRAAVGLYFDGLIAPAIMWKKLLNHTERRAVEDNDYDDWDAPSIYADGSFAATSSFTGAADRTRYVVGAVAGQSSFTGVASVVRSSTGAMAGVGSFSASASMVWHAVGALGATSTFTAYALHVIPAAGSFAGQCHTLGIPSVDRYTTGTVEAFSYFMGAATSGVGGTVTAVSSFVGVAKVTRPAIGSIAAVSTFAGVGFVDPNAIRGAFWGQGKFDALAVRTMGVSGAVAGQSVISGTVRRTRTAAGAIATTSTVAGTAKATRRASGAVAGQSAVSGAAGASKPVRGAATGVSSFVAVVSMDWHAAGAIGAVCAVTASARCVRPALGTLAAAGGFSAVGKRIRRVSGAAAASSTFSASGSVSRPVSGTIAVHSGSSASPTVVWAAAGRVDATGVLHGYAVRDRGVSGSIQCQSVISGLAGRTRPIAGAIATSGGISGAARVTRRAAGVVSGHGAVSGTANVVRRASGVAACHSAVSGVATVARSVVGTVNGQSTISANARKTITYARWFHREIVQRRAGRLG